MSAIAKAYYTPEEYLAFEREAEYKSEYINGQIYAMVGASRAHNLVGVNVSGELRDQFKSRSCEVYAGDMRVEVSPTSAYTYPDVVAVCEEPRFGDEYVDTLLNPVVIVEVLSPSTEAYDRGEKFAHYRTIASLTDYVLISQDKVRVEHFMKQSDWGDRWMLTVISSLDGRLQLSSIGCDLALRDIYDKVSFPEVEISASSPQA
jgi:Uma2 family endonuclease